MRQDERYRRVQELFESARQLSQAERESYLAQECGNDAALLVEVKSLIAHEQPAAAAFASGFLAKAAGSDVPLGGFPLAHESDQSQTAAECPTELRRLDDSHPEFIGLYRILEVLGEGGFGIVYLAEQLEPIRRRVALKILRAGLDTREVIARFEQERQALALMDHPHVSRVYDAGTTAEGRPYVVMEYVAGKPITQFCDEHGYSLRQRLDLVIAVCEAVQHAHTKGIIHRDIKPGNILLISAQI